MNEQNTALWERRLGDGLNALIDGDADAPAATVTVTVADLIAAGRVARRRRRRHSTFTLSAVLVVVAILSFGAVLAAGHDQSMAPPAKGGPPASIGTASDPAAPIVSFGWLPTALQGEYDIDQDPGSSDVTAWNVQGGASLEAYVNGYGSGFQPGPSAGAVRGHQAWWGAAPGSGQAAAGMRLVLMWHYAPGAWASLDYYNGTTDAAAGAMLLKVADNLVIGPPHAQALPFRLPKIPAHMHTDGVRVYLDQWQTTHLGDTALRFCVTSPCESGGLIVSQQSSTYLNAVLSQGLFHDAQADPFTGLDRPGTDKSTNRSVTVDNQQAKLWTTADNATLLFSDDGSAVMVSAAGTEYQAIGGESGLIAFARSLTWLGSNPAHWTTNAVG
jgi:hypothetical protein